MGPGDARLPVAAVAALQEGNKIQAIKLVREATGLGLKQAHDLVSAHIARDPALRELFGAMAARGRRGCLLIIGAVVAAVVAIIVSRHFSRVAAGTAAAGTAEGAGIVFQRDGVPEPIRATDGQATGMKWLMEKKNCLTVKPGEGYCRD